MLTLKPVKLEYNKPIKFRKRRTQKLSKYGQVQFHSDSKKVIKDLGVYDKNIQSYKMWFMFLKLALELEQQKATLITKRNVDKSVKITHKIKVNRKKYKDWDLDQVLTDHFNNWWGSHRHLFVDEGIQLLKDGDIVKNEAGYITVKINTNRRINDIKADISNYVERAAKKHKSQAKFPIFGNPRPLVLQNRYNALVLKLQNELSDKEIIDFRNGYLRASDGRIPTGYNTQHTSRTMFGLISGDSNVYGAKQILLSVCDGYFVKHPTKTYLE